MAINKTDYPKKIKTNLYANKSFTVFYYDFTQNKKRNRGIIDLSGKKGWGKRDRVSVAEAELIKIKNTKSDAAIDDRINLDDFVSKFFDLKPNTNWKKTRLSHYKRYISPHIGLKRLSSIRQMHIKQVIKEQEDIGLAPRTVKQTLEVLNPAFNEAFANRIIDFNPCYSIKIKLPKTKKIVTNATKQLKNIHEAISRAFKHDPLFHAMYLFALHGRRKGEILNLKKSDISLEHNYYIIRDTKNGETQKMHLPGEIKKLIIDLMDMEGEYLFTNPATGNRYINIEKQTRNIKRELGDPSFSLHYLRNVISSAMAESGLESVYQSGALGHGDLTTINKYSSLNYLKGSQMASGVIENIIKR